MCRRECRGEGRRVLLLMSWVICCWHCPILLPAHIQPLFIRDQTQIHTLYCSLPCVQVAQSAKPRHYPCLCLPNQFPLLKPTNFFWGFLQRVNPFLEKEKCPPVPKFQFTPHGNKFVGVNSGSIEASTAAPPFQSSSLSSSCGWGEASDIGELSFLSLAYFPFHFHFLERPVEFSERSSIITSSQNQNQSSFLLRQGRIQIKCNMWKKKNKTNISTRVCDES